MPRGPAGRPSGRCSAAARGALQDRRRSPDGGRRDLRPVHPRSLRAAFPADGWLSEEGDAGRGTRSAGCGSSIRSMAPASSSRASLSSPSRSPSYGRRGARRGRRLPAGRDHSSAPSRRRGPAPTAARGDDRARRSRLPWSWPAGARSVAATGNRSMRLSHAADRQHRLEDGARGDRRGRCHDQPGTQTRLGRLCRHPARRRGRRPRVTARRRAPGWPIRPT